MKRFDAAVDRGLTSLKLSGLSPESVKARYLLGDDDSILARIRSYADAGVAAFEVQALDFLVKPVTRDRLDAALARVAEVRTARTVAPVPDATPATAPEVVALDNPDGPGKRLVRLASIRSIEADGDYAQIHAADGVFTLRAALGQLEQDWGAAGRAHSPL